MAPFPEAEIMTIKRLEVALRKADYKLLREGAYKLHEKFHGGYKFEHLDLLKEIYVEVMENITIPEDTRTILAQTINDIIANQDVTVYKKEEKTAMLDVDDSPKPLPIAETENQETKVSAFDVFGSQKTNSTFTKTIVNQAMNNFVANSSNDTVLQEKNDVVENNSNDTQNPEIEDETLQKEELNVKMEQYTPCEMTETRKNGETFEEQVWQHPKEIVDNAFMEDQENVYIEEDAKKEEKKEVSIFFGQNSSREKSENIEKMRRYAFDFNKNMAVEFDIFSLISEIKTQTNSNVHELKSILERLKDNQNKTNLITTSQSADFFEVFKEGNIQYSLYQEKQECDVELTPLCGLSNLYKCFECQEKHLDLTNEKVKSLVFECPKCKKPMYMDLYAVKQNSEINIEYYNQALSNLVESKIWLLIQPSLNEKITFELIKTAFSLSNKVEEIFILDKDINVRENYKNMFLNIKPNIKVNTQITALEDFLGSI